MKIIAGIVTGYSGVVHLEKEELSFIPQTPELFNTTIFENIVLGQSNVSLNEVIKFTKLVEAHEFIENFAEGYQTLVGEKGFNLSVDGSYDQQDFEAVRVFQDRYFDDILAPWGHTKTTGYVFYTTRKKINEIYCKSVFPLTSEQQNEVDEFRAFLEQFQQGGIPGEVDTSVIGQEKIEEGLEEKKLAGLPDAPLTKQPGILAQLFGASFGDRSRVIGIVLVAFAGIIGIASILLVSRKSDK